MSSSSTSSAPAVAARRSSATSPTWVADGLPVIVDEVVPLGEYPAALERLRTATQLGKIVLEHPQ